MIYRKILKVKTVGSRKKGNLRPAFSDDFVNRYGKGVNYAVHEYNEPEGWCIIECWCSDHAVLGPQQKNMKDLDNIGKDNDVIESVSSHPRSPPILGQICLSGGHSPESVDKKNKTLVFKGKTMSFKKVKRHKTSAGDEEDLYILDEG